MDAFAPATFEEALGIQASHPEAVPIAGGTDLMVESAGRLRPAALLDLSRADASEPVPDVPSRHAVTERYGPGHGQHEITKARLQ